MNRTRFPRRSVSRAGLTLLELLAVIIGFVIIFSLLAPGIVVSRGHSRKLECANNLKQLTLATINYATTHRGRLPYLADDPPGRCDPSLTGQYEIPRSVSFHVALFPFIDQAGAIEYIEAQETSEKANQALQVVLKGSYKAFLCLENPDRRGSQGLNDYVANCGYGEFAFSGRKILQLGKAPHSASKFDAWDRDPSNGVSPLDKKIARATGVFWIPDTDGWQRSIDDVVSGDGANQTIMYSEKSGAGSLLLAGTTAARCGFLIGRSSIRFSGTATNYLEISYIPRPFRFGINRRGPTTAQPAPTPSSNHKDSSGSGLVNVSFCDGHVASLSDGIDRVVYAQLLSPNGVQFGQTQVDKSEY
jgi:prepilin-type processing-associated H-X9-DG protein